MTDETNKKPLVIITGPTAAGKTALSIELAKTIGGEVISADSMQVYRGMDIGTAKITHEEMRGVPHHLIDILEPEEDFNVFEFQRRAKEAALDIISRGKIPIVVGGTGFYIQALLYGIEFSEDEPDTALREELRAESAKDADKLYERLKEVDPAACGYIHKNNIKRVIRAIEFFETTGQRISEHNASQREREAEWKFAYFVLDMDRDILYERINRRVDIMMEQGLLDEVRKMQARGLTKDHVSMKGLGYKEFFDAKSPEEIEKAVEILKRDTRHFAKRQLTWFRRERDVYWLNKTCRTDNELLKEILEILDKKRIIDFPG